MDSSVAARAAALVACALALAAFASGDRAQKPAKPADAQKAVSEELRRLYEDDQKDQNDPSWTAENDRPFLERQTVRRNRAFEIVKAGQLANAADWGHAAILFQHGEGADDFLLAHVLSIPTATEELAFGRFMTAATLDRFLQHVDRPQIFTTQSGSANPNDFAPIEPYDDRMGEWLREIFDQKPLPRPDTTRPPPKKAAGAATAKELPRLAKEARAAGRVAADAVAPAWLARTREIVFAGPIESDKDLRIAAEILAASDAPDDLVYAHVLTVAATLRNKKPDSLLPACAGTLDRMLAGLGRPQRFGTITGEGAPVLAEPPLHEVILARYGLANPTPAAK